MDTPVKNSVPSASASSPNPASEFEDSPIFKYINDLSPIKPPNSVQSFNLLSFASPKSPITSPATTCPLKSKTSCSKLSYSIKPEPEDGEDGFKETQITDNGVQPVEVLAGTADYPDSSLAGKPDESHELLKSVGDASQSTCKDPGISLTEPNGKQEQLDSGIKVTSALDEATQLSIGHQKCISRDHGGFECKADDITNSVSQAVDSEISPGFFIQGNSDNCEFSYDSNLALQGVQLQQMKGQECRWEKMLVEAADQLLCDFPMEEVDLEEGDDVHLDSAMFSFMENVLQPPEENSDDIMKTESVPLGSIEEHDVKVPCAHSNGAKKHSEAGQASTHPSVDKVVLQTHADVHNTPYPEPEQTYPKSCLVFEMSGSNYRKKLTSEAGETSLISKQSACTAITNEKRLVSSKCEVYNSSSLLPGIGLHLNSLSRRETIIVKQEVSTCKRQLISIIPCTTSSLHSTSSDSKPIDSASDIDPIQEDLESSNSVGKLKENVSQSSAFTADEELNRNSIKWKRCKSENARGYACTRCNCKRSKCLKLYCECFAAGLYCVDPCSCQGCLNKPAFEETVLETRKMIESRNPLAFAPKVITFSDASECRDALNKTPASARHKRGCNCKKSGCLKKYCECFQGGVGCSLGCRCDGCRNSFGRKDGDGTDNILLEAIESTEDNSTGRLLNVDMEDRDLQVTPSSEISRIPSGFSGLDSHLPSLSKRLLHPCTNHKQVKKTYFSCNDTLGAPFLRKIAIEDDTANVSRDENDTSTSTSVKSVSLNSKRVSPPRKFCRKVILRSIPSFPKLPDKR